MEPDFDLYDYDTAEYHCLDLVKRQTDDLYLLFLGTQRCPPGHFWGPTKRGEYLLHFVVSGTGTYQVGERVYHPKRGQVFLIRPEATTFYQADETDPWHYAWVAFDGKNVETYLKYAGFTDNELVLECGCAPEQYEELIRQMLEMRELTLANEIKRVGHLFRLLSLLIKSQHLAPKARGESYDYPYEAYVEYAQEYIRRNYRHTKVSEIADYIGINRSYLASIFKKKLNISPQEYLVGFRLEKARELLRGTTLNIKEISDQVGYDDPLTFSKMFKRYFQLSPRAYRAGLQDSGPQGQEAAAHG